MTWVVFIICVAVTTTISLVYPQIRVFLLAERESQEEVTAAADADTKMAVYDRIIKDCVDALQVVKEELKNDPVRWRVVLCI